MPYCMLILTFLPLGDCRFCPRSNTTAFAVTTKFNCRSLSDWNIMAVGGETIEPRIRNNGTRRQE